MSKELLKRVIDKGVEGNLNAFFQDVSKYYRELDDALSEHNSDQFTGFQAIGEINFSPQEKMVVVTAEVEGDLTERSGKKAQYEKARKILKQYQRYDAGIFVFSDSKRNFRLSLVYGTPDAARLVWSNFRRFTYYASPSLTNKTFFDRVGNCSFANVDAVKDAFSVEKVNKEFYSHIARFFYRLTGYDCKREMTLPSVSDDDKETYQEFAVRLIGRMIFCWFLKHKKSANGVSLIPESILSSEAVRQNSQYYHATLEKLFFEVLNTPQEQRHKNILQDADKIPFLNGGLFESHKDDFYSGKPLYNLVIPDTWFKQFFEILGQYNFTIDENSAVDADVSVDPEMLGRIFENLLAEVNPDTGETARKATGSYYTPRTIVDYMVDQSLKQYLITKTKIDEGRINALLSYEAMEIALSDSEKVSIISALDAIKIIDPACGSGAFPMGILHKMLLVLQKVDPELKLWLKNHLGNIEPGIFKDRLLERIQNENWEYVRKLIIIQKSVYGVDIQAIAVEISKLRFFLSLIVDEQIDDRKNNRGVEALPNLEFKFVSANSLIGLPPVMNRQVGLGIVNDEVIRLKELRNKYLRSYGIEKKRIEEDFLKTRGKLFEQNVSWGGKDALALQLTNWNPFSSETSNWFDSDWMFGVEDGFDIVIANPPYMDSRAMVGRGQKDLREAITKTYSMTRGSWDIYIAFFELGLKTMKEEGILTFITPDKWISKPFGDELRKGTINKIFAVIRSGREVFESSSVDSIISLFSGKRSATLKLFDFEDNRIVFKREVKKELLKPPFTLDYLFSNYLDLLLKIGNIKNSVSDLATCENACATDDAYKLKPLVKDTSKGFDQNHQMKIVNTGTISKYFTRWGCHEMTYLGRKYLCPVVDKGKFLTLFKKSYAQKSLQPKIIIKGLNLLDACLDAEGAVIPGIPTLLITGKDLNRLKFLLSIINSKLAFFYIKERYPSSSYNLGTNFTPDMINNLPLPILTENERESFIKNVDDILRITAATDYYENKEKQAKVKELERQIDQLIYELYGLTPEEITVVEVSVKR